MYKNMENLNTDAVSDDETVELLKEAVTAKVSARGSGELLTHAIANSNEGVILFAEAAPSLISCIFDS